MDPVQLMMAAHQADAAVAAQTPDQALQAAIAQSRPDLWAPLSTNPAAYPDLLGWLASTGNVEVLANLRARGYLTDDAAANAADAAGAAGTAGAADGDPAAEPAVAQDVAAQTKSAEPAGGSATPVNEDEAETAEESEPVEESDTESSESSESSENVETTEIVDDGEAEVAEADEGVQAAESAAEAAAETDAEAQTAQDAADGAQEPGSEEPDDEAGDEPGTDPAAEPTAEPSVEPAELDEAADADDDSGETSDEQETTEEPAEPAEGTEGAVVTESADADESAEGAESAAEAAAGTDAEAQTTQDAADEAQEPGSEEPDDEAAGADDVAVPADEEPKADESTEAEDVEPVEPVEPVNDDTTALSPASQWHEVDSADTTDVTASAQSAAAATGWTAGSAESVALPVPPPPSAEDIAAWAETPSGVPSGFSAAQPAVELDMFGPRMVAQVPPPQQQKRSSSSNTGRLVAIIVVLLLVIAGGGGVWAGNYFASKDKGGDSSRDRADTNGDEGGQQNNGQADAAATSTAAALPSGAVKACSSMPTFTITSVEDGQGELKVRGNVATACTEGDFLAGSSNQVLVYSSTSPTGGTDADHLVASGTFDLSSDPLIIPNGGRTVTLRFGEQHYFRTAKDLDLKRLSVRPSFDRGSPSSATSKSSTNSPMTIASSASSNANQEAQDEQAAGDAIQWQVKHDYPVVMNSMRGKWTPQLSTKQVGVLADGQTWTNRSILAEFLRTRQANPKAVIVSTSEWPVFDEGGWWVTLSGELYATADEANVWCDTQGYDRDHCLAKRMESSGSPQGTTKSR